MSISIYERHIHLSDLVAVSAPEDIRVMLAVRSDTFMTAAPVWGLCGFDRSGELAVVCWSIETYPTTQAARTALTNAWASARRPGV